MGRFRVWVKPFTDAGVYQDEWIEITEDVDFKGLGQLKESLDNTEYDIGVFRNNGITLTLINSDGRYSDVGGPGTIFKYSRSNSLVKITWEAADFDIRCGFVYAGNFVLSEPIELFIGLLNDDALKQQADEQNLAFKVLGRESVLSQVEVPFSSISNGNLFSNIIFKCLNQARITDVLTVDVSNIACGIDIAIDDKSDLENQTVLEALKDLLLNSNSVLFVRNGAIYVAPRDPSPTVLYTFYGQGAFDGLENIIEITDFRSGLNRTFNYWTWEDTTLKSDDATSVLSYGIRKKEIGIPLVTNNTKRQNILDALKSEFAYPKKEFVLRVPMDNETIALGLLDRIKVNYPNAAATSSGVLPVWDASLWDVDRFPVEILPIEIDPLLDFKILSRTVDPTNQELIFEIREV